VCFVGGCEHFLIWHRPRQQADGVKTGFSWIIFFGRAGGRACGRAGRRAGAWAEDSFFSHPTRCRSAGRWKEKGACLGRSKQCPRRSVVSAGGRPTQGRPEFVQAFSSAREKNSGCRGGNNLVLMAVAKQPLQWGNACGRTSSCDRTDCCNWWGWISREGCRDFWRVLWVYVLGGGRALISVVFLRVVLCAIFVAVDQWCGFFSVAQRVKGGLEVGVPREGCSIFYIEPAWWLVGYVSRGV